MWYIIQWVRSLFFIIQMYIALLVIGFGFVPLILINRKYVYTSVHAYCNWVRWTASWMVGLRSEIRGEIPSGEVLVASKHQSFFDILIIASVIPEPKYIIKKQLTYVPVIGLYGRLTNSVFVDRGKRGAAIKKMIADVKAGDSLPGQLVIFPQGTRVAARAEKPYKIGAGILYRETGQPCIPASTNVGIFWKRHGIMRYPGTAVIEFHEVIQPGLQLHDFMKTLETVIETNSNRLMDEADLQRK